MGTILLYIFISALLSFFCSVLEAVLLSVTPSYIAMELKKGRNYAKLLEHLKEHINRPISAILALNTLANIGGGALVGATVHRQYGDQYLAIFSGLATFFILVAGELVPKILGATQWKRLAPVSAYLIRGLILILWPLVWLAERLARLMGQGPDQAVSREEVIVTAELSADEGAIRQKESTVIKNLLMLDNMKVADIMTPRSVMYAFPSGMTVGEIVTKHKPIRFSRIPVYQGSVDHIMGIVHRYKILEEVSHDRDNVRLDDLMTPVHSIPGNISVAAALDQFIKRHEHVFIVTDDYGSTTGIVSLEDAIETLLGVEIVDEFDSVADLRQLALEQWRDRKQKIQGTKQ